jgi:hypothetical protein
MVRDENEKKRWKNTIYISYIEMTSHTSHAICISSSGVRRYGKIFSII